MHLNVTLYVHFLSSLVSTTITKVKEWEHLHGEYSILGGTVINTKAGMQDNLIWGTKGII